MKSLFIIVVTSFVFGINVNSQQPRILKADYYVMHNLVKGQYEFIHLYTINQKKVSEDKLYFRKNKKQYRLATFNEENVLVSEKIIEKDSLFKIVKHNLRQLYKIRESKAYFNILKERRSKNLQIINNLAIKYSYLHFNHYEDFAEEEILKLKRKKMREAQRQVNLIISRVESLSN